MNKKIILFGLIIACLSLSACNNKTPDATQPDDNTSNDPIVEKVDIPESEYEYYFEHYLSSSDLFNYFEISYTENTFVNVFQSITADPYPLYANSLFQESSWSEFVEEYEDCGIIPADYVETLVSRHYPLKPVEFRALTPTDEENYNYYDPSTNTYVFQGGYGGPGKEGKIYKATKEGNILELSCEWFDYFDNSLVFSHKVTIVLGDTPLDYYYRENIVTNDSPNR